MRLNSGTVNSAALAGLTLLSIVGGIESSQVQAAQATIGRTATSATASSQSQGSSGSAQRSIVSGQASSQVQSLAGQIDPSLGCTVEAEQVQGASATTTRKREFAASSAQAQSLDSQISRTFLAQIATNQVQQALVASRRDITTIGASEQAQGAQLTASLSVLWSSAGAQAQASSADSQREVLAYVEAPRFQSGTSNGFALGGGGLNAGSIYPANIEPISQIQSASASASLLLVSPGVVSYQAQQVGGNLERSVLATCQGFVVQSASGAFSRTMPFDVESAQAQSHAGIVMLLSGEPSIYHADVALQDFIAVVPQMNKTAYVPFVEYEAVVPEQNIEAIV